MLQPRASLHLSRCCPTPGWALASLPGWEPKPAVSTQARSLISAWQTLGGVAGRPFGCFPFPRHGMSPRADFTAAELAVLAWLAIGVQWGGGPAAGPAHPTSERSPCRTSSGACLLPRAVTTSRLPLETQPLLGRPLAVGLGICWQQSACTGGAVAGAGGSPHIPRAPALYLCCPRSLPTPSGLCAPLLIAPYPWRTGDRPWGAWPVVVFGDPWWGSGFFHSRQGHRECSCGICKHRCCLMDK